MKFSGSTCASAVPISFVIPVGLMHLVVDMAVNKTHSLETSSVLYTSTQASWASHNSMSVVFVLVQLMPRQSC